MSLFGLGGLIVYLFLFQGGAAVDECEQYGISNNVPVAVMCFNNNVTTNIFYLDTFRAKLAENTNPCKCTATPTVNAPVTLSLYSVVEPGYDNCGNVIAIQTGTQAINLNCRAGRSILIQPGDNALFSLSKPSGTWDERFCITVSANSTITMRCEGELLTPNTTTEKTITSANPATIPTHSTSSTTVNTESTTPITTYTTTISSPTTVTHSTTPTITVTGSTTGTPSPITTTNPTFTTTATHPTNNATSSISTTIAKSRRPTSTSITSFAVSAVNTISTSTTTYNPPGNCKFSNGKTGQFIVPTVAAVVMLLIIIALAWYIHHNRKKENPYEEVQHNHFNANPYMAVNEGFEERCAIEMTENGQSGEEGKSTVPHHVYSSINEANTYINTSSM